MKLENKRYLERAPNEIRFEAKHAEFQTVVEQARKLSQIE